MNRRGFLAFLGLAPVVAVAASQPQAATMGWARGGIVPSRSFWLGRVGESGPELVMPPGWFNQGVPKGIPPVYPEKMAQIIQRFGLQRPDLEHSVRVYQSSY